jgi:hypothetical protein
MAGDTVIANKGLAMLTAFASAFIIGIQFII